MTTISHNDIARAIYLSTNGKTNEEQKAVYKRIVNFLAKRALLSKSPKILSKLSEIINKENNILEVKVYSSAKLDDKTKRDLIHTLVHKYKTEGVNLVERVDENLIGGVKIEIGDEVLDLTLKNRVKKLQAYLTKNHE